MDKLKAGFAEKFEPVIDKIGSLTKIQRYLIYCGSLLALAGIFVYFIYLPKQEKISSLGGQYEKLKKQLDSTKKKAAQLKKWQKSMDEARLQFQVVKKTLPEKEDIPSLLASISQSGRDAGLEFILFKPNRERAKGFYAEIPVSINVTGNYHNLALFFARVANLPRIVNIRNIKLSGGTRLKASCTAVTYRFIKAKAAKKRKKRRRR